MERDDELFIVAREKTERSMEDKIMDEVISREEHEEFSKRMDAELKRHNKRIELLEETTKQINAIIRSVEKLAQSVETMAKEQEKQGKRLEAMENRDGEMWRKAVGYIVTCVIGIALGFVFKQIGM